MAWFFELDEENGEDWNEIVSLRCSKLRKLVKGAGSLQVRCDFLIHGVVEKHSKLKNVVTWIRF